MKVLLTGSRGFIGSYFQKHYMQKYTIRTFSFLKDDLNALHVKEIDVVIHLSALVHQMSGASDEAYEKMNVMQTLELALKAKESGVKQFIFMSTVKVYGEESDLPYTEISLCHPQDAYGRTKLKAEQELQKLTSEDFSVSIIRTPIVYGYGVKANIKNLVTLVANISLLPFGNIHNKRSLTYVGNLCAMIDKIIEKKKSGIFLAGDDKPLSTTRLIELIALNLKKKVFFINLPLFSFLLKWIKPSFYKRLFESLEIDNTQTKKILEFQNPYSMEDGIKLMIQGSTE